MLLLNIIYEYNELRGHQGITRTVNMICRYFYWPGMRSSIYQHIRTCKPCAQMLANKVNTKPMHLKIPQLLFAGCAVDTIGLLPTTSHLIAVPLKSKTAKEVTMIYIKHILPITSCSTFILQDNSTEFKNSQLIATFKSLGIKPIYSNPYRPQGEKKALLLYSTARPESFSSTLQPYPWQGTHPTLV